MALPTFIVFLKLARPKGAGGPHMVVLGALPGEPLRPVTVRVSDVPCVFHTALHHSIHLKDERYALVGRTPDQTPYCATLESAVAALRDRGTGAVVQLDATEGYARIPGLATQEWLEEDRRARTAHALAAAGTVWRDPRRFIQ